MKRAIKIIISAVLCLSLISVSVFSKGSVQALEQSAVVKSVGLDSTAEKYELTFVHSVIGDSSSQKQAVVVSADTSFADAWRGAQILADKYLTFSFVNDFIIGMPSAKENIAGSLDFISSSKKVQLSSFIYISDSDARTLLEDISKDIISTDEVLLNLNTAGSTYGYYYPVSVLELMRNKLYGETVVPVIGQKSDGLNSAKKCVVVFKGYGVIRDNKLIYIISKKQARAYNFLSNKMQRSFFDFDGNVFEIKKSRASFSFQIQGSKLKKVTVNLDIGAGISAVSDADLFDEKACAYLHEKLRAEIISEIRQLFRAMKENNSDLLGFKNKVYQKTGKKVDFNLSDVRIVIKLTSKLNTNFDLKEGAGNN